MHLKNSATAATLGTQITVADTFLSRLVGLIGKPRLDTGCGLLIRPSSGIHTFGMRFAIDVLALSKDFEVLRLWRRLEPCRMTSLGWKTHCMLELPAGQIERCGVEIGDRLKIVSLTRPAL